MENNKYKEPNIRFATVGGGKNAQPLANKDDCSINNVEKSVPKLRFGEFEGEWESPLIKDVFEIRNGYTPSKEVSRFWEGGTIPWFRMEDIRENGGILEDSIQHITPLGLKGTGLFEKGSIILATTATIGVHAMLIADSLANQRFTNFKIRKSLAEDYDQYFVYYSFFGIDEWSKRNSNSGGLLAVDIPGLLRTEYIVPSLSEQQKIASYFTSLDQQIKAATKRVASLKQVKAACLQSMFPKEGETVPKVRFQGFEGEWKKAPLNCFANKRTEKNTRKQYSVTFTNSAEFGIVDQRSFFDHDISNKENIEGYYVVRTNDFVYNPRISVSAPVGPINLNMLGYTGVVSPLYFVFEVHDICHTFLKIFYQTTLWHKYMYDNGNTGARFDRLAISDDVFMKMPIPNITIPEQQKIATFFTSLDKQIDLESQRLEKLKQVKRACLDKMFV